MVLLVSAIAIVLAVVLTVLVLSDAFQPNSGQQLISDRAIGSGDNDFWTVYPDGNPSEGAAVGHPTWVLNNLTSHPIMILTHQEGCVGCAIQLPICNDINSTHVDNLTYIRLSSELEYERVYDCIMTYDPDGNAHYVPLTVVVTQRMDGDGRTVIAWHAWEGVVAQAELTSWIDDAIDHWAGAGTPP